MLQGGAAETTLTINGGYIVARIFGCGQTQLIVTDATNRTIETSQVIGVRGANATVTPPTPPTPPSLTVSPTTFSLACGASGGVTVAGVGSYQTNPVTIVSATAFSISNGSGSLPNSITFTRLNAGTGVPTLITVNVVNGTIVVPVNITVPATCP